MEWFCVVLTNTTLPKNSGAFAGFSRVARKFVAPQLVWLNSVLFGALGDGCDP